MNNESEVAVSKSSIAPKIAIFVVAISALYLVATWLIGRTAHVQVDAMMDRMTDQFKGQLRIVERKSTPGFFKSTEDVTLGIDNPLYASMFTSSKPQFTIHNVITHGPLPGLRSVGIARVESTLAMTDSQRKELIEILGTDKPIEVAVTIGLLGATSVRVTSPTMNVKVPKETTVIDWKGMQMRADYSRDFKDIKMAGSAPGFVIEAKDGKSFEVGKLTLDANLQSMLDSLYVGNETFKAEYVKSGAGPAAMDFHDLTYTFTLSAETDFYNVDGSMSAGSITFDAANIKDVRFDFGLNHLHAVTLASLSKKFQDFTQATKNMASDPATAAELPTDALKADFIALLQHSPVLNFKHIGFATQHGDMKFFGHAEFNGVAEADFDLATMSQKLLAKLSASGDLTITQSLIDEWPIGMTGEQAKQTFSQLEGEGYLQRKGDRLETHLEWKDGSIIANGKKVGGEQAK